MQFFIPRKRKLYSLVKTRGRRSSHGYYLVGTLVALLIGVLVSFALLQLLVETLRVTSTNSNKQSADLMIQTTLDSTKAWSYQNRAQPQNLTIFQPGNYALLADSTTSGQVLSTALVHPLPVGLNKGDLTWKSSYKFPGTISLDLADVPIPNSLSQSATASVSWMDSGNINGRTISTQSIIHQRGITFWPSP